jgi:nicotinamidase-related amidase
MLQKSAAALIVIDVQDKLLPAMAGAEALVANVARLIRGAAALGLPIVYTEQYPQGLGRTIPELLAILPGQPVAKTSFSCCGEPAFMARIKELGRRQFVVVGIEAHVCVHQTVAGLLAAGYEVEFATDAIASRTEANRELARQRMQAAGARPTSAEMALFELLERAQGDAFKAILKIVK